MGYGLLAEPEMANFATAYLAAPTDTKVSTKTGAHAALYRFTDPARQRYAALLTTDPAAPQAFRAGLRSYSRAYALLAAIMPWHDPDLERLYLFGKFLLLLLDRRGDPGVDIGKVDVTHLRVVRKGAEDASLGADAGDQVLPGDENLRAAAKANTLENYGYVFDPRFEELMLDRHEANGELIRRFLDSPDVNEVFTSWVRRESYRRIRADEAC